MTRHVTATWRQLVRRTGTEHHAQHLLVTVLLMQTLSEHKRAGWIGRHRRMLHRAVIVLENVEGGRA